MKSFIQELVIFNYNMDWLISGCRYYKRALKRAGQSTDESMSDDEHEASKNDNG